MSLLFVIFEPTVDFRTSDVTCHRSIDSITIIQKPSPRFEEALDLDHGDSIYYHRRFEKFIMIVAENFTAIGSFVDPSKSDDRYFVTSIHSFD